MEAHGRGDMMPELHDSEVLSALPAGCCPMPCAKSWATIAMGL